jgi:hypothetical protein
MDMILLDWTRMGRWYCLAGVVAEGRGFRVVRPLLRKHQDAPVRNVGWSAYLLDGHARWEIFELVGAVPAAPEPPHVEDLWVRGLRPRHRSAPPGQRRDILAATTLPDPDPCFGVPLSTTRAAAYLPAGAGQRSLATVVVPARTVQFTAAQRIGAAEPDLRVRLPLPGLEGRLLPVKDHHLLRRGEATTANLEGQARGLQYSVQQMGERVAVRLGLSRPYQPSPEGGPGFCWLMADGFFSLNDPQP